MSSASPPKAKSTLLTTKLFAPRRRERSVERPALVQRIEEGKWRPLTLVVGPAGFGKTTLVGQWLAQSDIPVAWLSLEEADSDPLRFLSYVLASVGRIRPEVGGQIESIDSSSREVSLIALLADQLVIPLAEETMPFALVLDDFHKLKNDAISVAIDWLLDNAPPCMHLVITTREEPALSLATRRARDSVTEILASDLSFSETEAGPFFNQAMGLELDAEATKRLHIRTEGWAVGMQLASLSLKRGATVDEVLDGLSVDGDIAEFLVREILDALEPSQRAFLLDISVLDRLNDSLCNAVMESTTAASDLLRAFRDGLFLISLDHKRQWYRFHDLFRDILRRRLLSESPDRENLVRCRAARWWMTQDDPYSAGRLAIAAGADELLGEIVEGWGLRTILTSDRGVVAHWLDSLPDHAMDNYPAVGVVTAWSAILPVFAPPQLEMALEAIARARGAMERSQTSNERRAELEEHLTIVETIATRPFPDPAACIAHSIKVMATLKPDALLPHVTLSMQVGVLHLMLGQPRQALPHLAATQRKELPIPTCSGMGYQAWNFRELGELDRADERCTSSLKLYRELGLGQKGMAGLIYLEQAKTNFERWNLPVALASLEEALPRIRVLSDPIVLVDALALQSRILTCAGDAELANLASEEVKSIASQYPHPIVQGLSIVAEWAQALSRGEAPAILLPPADEYQVMVHELSLYPALFAIAGDQSADALQLAISLLKHCSDNECIAKQLDWMVVVSLGLYKLGRKEEATEKLSDALSHSQGYRIQRPFMQWRHLLSPLAKELDEVGDGIWQAMQGHLSQPANPPLKVIPSLTSPTLPPLSEKLSPRELEVLTHVRLGRSNSEVASELFVSLGTIKTHMHRLLRKLEAKNRVDAIRIAEGHGLL